MKYFLKGDWEKEYTEVIKEQYIQAEKSAGFCSKVEGERATDAFSGHGVSGEVVYESSAEFMGNGLKCGIS